MGADPKIESSVSDEVDENLLEVSARWNHVNVFNFLLREVDWTEEEITKVAKLKRRSPLVTRNLKAYSSQ